MGKALSFESDFDRDAIRAERIEEKALKITERGMRSLDAADIQTTLHRIIDDESLLSSFAEHVRRGRHDQLFHLIERELENDLYLFGITEATKAVDDGV